MSRSTEAAAVALIACLATACGARAADKFPGIGRVATPAEVRAWDIDVRPDFKGLPPGSGSVAQGQAVWEAKCALCHGTFGESNEIFTPIVGGTTRDDIRTGHVASLKGGEPQRSTLMKLSSVSTLWDYVNRAMPWNAPKSLSHDEVYAVVAYILNLGDIVPADFTLSNANIAQVQDLLPNRHGKTRAHGLWDLHGKPDVRNVACMKDCVTESKVASEIPEYAQDSHGDVHAQNRRFAPSTRVASVAAPNAAAPRALASEAGCLACHALQGSRIGPGFDAVAARYRGDTGAPARLAAKVRAGGSGVWGNVPMPPHPAIPDAALKTLVQWVLAGAPAP